MWKDHREHRRCLLASKSSQRTFEHTSISLQVLFEITEEFLEKAPELQLISFFEMEATNFAFFRKMVSEVNC